MKLIYSRIVYTVNIILNIYTVRFYLKTTNRQHTQSQYQVQPINVVFGFLAIQLGTTSMHGAAGP